MFDLLHLRSSVSAHGALFVTWDFEQIEISVPDYHATNMSTELHAIILFAPTV